MSEKEETEVKDSFAANLVGMIGTTVLAAMLVGFVSIFFSPMTSIAASIYAFTAIASITLFNK